MSTENFSEVVIQYEDEGRTTEAYNGTNIPEKKTLESMDRGWLARGYKIRIITVATTVITRTPIGSDEFSKAEREAT